MIEWTQDRWERVRERAALWWSGELKGPLIQVDIRRGHQPGGPPSLLPYRPFTVHHGMEAPIHEIVDTWDYALSGVRFLGDAFPGEWPCLGADAMAAFLGAEMLMDDHTVWYHADRPLELEEIRFEYDPDNPWLEWTRRVYRAALERWDGNVLLGMTDIGAPLDVLAHFRGSGNLLVDLLANPDEVMRLNWKLHDLFFRFYDDLISIVAPVNPGYFYRGPRVYSETPVIMVQCDFSYGISPELFDQIVKPEIVAECRRADHSIYHLDGVGALPHLDSLLQIEELDAIQWVPGAGKPGYDHWPEVYRKIRNAGKKIHLWAHGMNVAHFVTIAEQIGSADDIVLTWRGAPADREREIRDFLKRYGVPCNTN